MPNPNANDFLYTSLSLLWVKGSVLTINSFSHLYLTFSFYSPHIFVWPCLVFSPTCLFCLFALHSFFIIISHHLFYDSSSYFLIRLRLVNDHLNLEGWGDSLACQSYTSLTILSVNNLACTSLSDVMHRGKKKKCDWGVLCSKNCVEVAFLRGYGKRSRFSHGSIL